MMIKANKNNKVKLTLRLSSDVMRTTNNAVESGYAPTITAFVEEAIRAKAIEVRHAQMRKLAAEAMADPDFVSDMHETMTSFDSFNRDGWNVASDIEETNEAAA